MMSGVGEIGDTAVAAVSGRRQGSRERAGPAQPQRKAAIPDFDRRLSLFAIA
jgi:hypothetical protein